MGSVQQMIEKRAYELFLSRGSVNGYASQDWAQAEKEINAELEKNKAKQVQQKPVEKPAEKPVVRIEKKEEPVKAIKEEPKDKTIKAPAAPAAPAKKRAVKKN
jgi:hypothetical protein